MRALSLLLFLLSLLPVLGVEKELATSAYRGDFFRLVRYYETQATKTWCAVASSVMVLNALQIPRPDVPAYGYPFFTQHGFFTHPVERLVPQEAVNRRGMTLDELESALLTFPVNVGKYRSDAIDEELFRYHLCETLNDPKSYMIINYFRPCLGQEGFGHFSPIGAYDQTSDSVLILDVSRYKYGPFWVKTKALFASLLPHDRATDRPRGYLIVSS